MGRRRRVRRSVPVPVRDRRPDPTARFVPGRRPDLPLDLPPPVGTLAKRRLPKSVAARRVDRAVVLSVISQVDLRVGRRVVRRAVLIAAPRVGLRIDLLAAPGEDRRIDLLAVFRVDRRIDLPVVPGVGRRIDPPADRGVDPRMDPRVDLRAHLHADPGVVLRAAMARGRDDGRRGIGRMSRDLRRIGSGAMRHRGGRDRAVLTSVGHPLATISDRRPGFSGEGRGDRSDQTATTLGRAIRSAPSERIAPNDREDLRHRHDSPDRRRPGVTWKARRARPGHRDRRVPRDRQDQRVRLERPDSCDRGVNPAKSSSGDKHPGGRGLQSRRGMIRIPRALRSR